MRAKLLFLAMTLIVSTTLSAQNCGTAIFIDEFNTAGSIPTEWTEFNTSGQVTVEGGLLKFDYTANQPAAYRSFTPETENVSVSFDVKSTRNWVKCKVNLYSSTGKYITGLMIGNDGTKNIQYATSLDGSGLPTSYTGALLDGNYSSNTLYSVNININFENQKLSFYQGGTLKANDIAFLETVTDVAKIEIIQVSMYSSEGRFFFDNVSVASQGIDRSGLSGAIAEATDAMSMVILSPKYGYPEDVYLSLKSALEDANAVLLNCDATEADLAQAEADLAIVKSTFDDAYVDEPVLKFYSAYGFTGDEEEFKCGYYNGTIGAFDNKAVSFKLEKGYMATFAQDVDGLGYSKVYIAQDDAIELNLPEELQRSISFMRVSPWYDTQKKGSCGKGADVMDALEADWYYAWGMTNGYSTPEREFVPMSWSGGNGFSGLAACRTAGQNMTFNHHLGFNEPDLEDQSNMTVAKALEIYPQLLASGLRLGSPAVANVSYSLKNGEFNEGAWIVEFLDSCMARGYRVDFIAVHEYVRYTASQHITRFKAISDRYNLPVWVTEYNYGNPNIGSKVLEDSVELVKIKAMNDKFDSNDFIERYSMFYFQPSQGQLTIFETRSPIVLNDLGEYTRDHESPYPSYAQEVYEDGPNIPAGVDDIASVGNIQIYPNPVSGNVINLNYNDATLGQDAVVSLYDISGKVVLTQGNSPTTIDVAHLQNGFYMLRVESQLGDATQKILISK